MNRTLADIEGILPLVAGAETTRRVGLRTPIIQLVEALLPVPPPPPYYLDTFSGTGTMLTHEADIRSAALPDGKYSGGFMDLFNMVVSGGVMKASAEYFARSGVQYRPEFCQGLWTWNVISPTEGSGVFRLILEGGGYPYGGFDDNQSVRGHWDGAGNLTVQIAREGFSPTEQVVAYTPGQAFEGSIAYDRNAASAVMAFAGVSASTSIPTDPNFTVAFASVGAALDVVQAVGTGGC